MSRNMNILKTGAIIMAMIFLSITVLEIDAHARGGGGRTSGSRGSRSYSSPGQSSSPWGQQSRQTAPPPGNPVPGQQPAGGGFLRSFGGGLLGGLVGGMLFRSLGFGGFGGGGFGLFDILLLAGLGYFLYTMFIKRRAGDSASRGFETGPGYQGTAMPDQKNAAEAPASPADELYQGLARIRQTDQFFDEAHFKDTAMDIFFKVQSAWMNRDLKPAQGLLTDEMLRIFQSDVDQLLRDKKVNRLENIAVRNVAIIEAWQDPGQDFITTLFHANLLDYTTSDETGEVIDGSKTEPVKFQEYWTFTRPAGNTAWKLSAINQLER